MGELSVIQNHNNQIVNARSYGAKELQLIKRTVAKDTTDDEFNMFIEICRRQGLDPFRRQIYALVFNKDSKSKRQVAFITGIDGYRAIAKRTRTFRPADREPEYEYDEGIKCENSNPLGIVKCTYTVHQFGPDLKWYAVVGTARWKEFAPIEPDSFEWVDTGEKWADSGKPKMKKVPKNGAGMKLTKDTWRSMPEVMISKCAEAQAIRKGWPEEVGGLYVNEEVDFMRNEDETATEAIEVYEEELRLKAVKGKDHVPMIMADSVGIEMIHSDQLADKVIELLRGFESAQEQEE